MNWLKKKIDSEEVKELASRYGLSLLEASVFLRRGILQGDDLLYYLEDDLRFTHNPFLFSQMEDAVDRILAARDEGEKVLVFGDRDVDGISATVLLTQALQTLGITVEWKVPQGDASYGLPGDLIQNFADRGGLLIITVDCGISNIKEIELANSLGVDVIVVDHHEAPGGLPDAFAIINPKVPDETYPFSKLSAAGVVVKLVWALRFAETPLYNQRLCVLHAKQEDELHLVVEACRMVNLVQVKRIKAVFGPESQASDLGPLIDFLQNQEIYVYDEKKQILLLKKLFGRGVDIGLFDLAPNICKAFPALENLSFDEVKAKSRLSRYQIECGDLDILISLFITSVYKTFPSLGVDFLSILDLTAMATLADLMPLEDENRILVRLGMQTLNHTKRDGLRGLMLKLGLLGRPLSTSDISWSLTPVVNSAGRMNEPEKAVELFLTDSQERRKELSQELEGLNQKRKKLSSDFWEKVLPPARQYWESSEHKFSFVYNADIPRGITGVLASRLMNTLGVPTLVMTSQDNKVVASLRTNRQFQTRKFLEAFTDLFTDFGGHAQAAGFNMPLDNLEQFQKRLEKIIPDFPIDDSQELETIEIDAELPLEYMKLDLFNLIDLLEPYGEGNRPLTFCVRGVRIQDMDIVGKDTVRHAKLTVDTGDSKWPAIYWNVLPRIEKKEFSKGDTVDLAFHLGKNYYQGQETPQLTIVDLVRTKMYER